MAYKLVTAEERKLIYRWRKEDRAQRGICQATANAWQARCQFGRQVLAQHLRSSSFSVISVL